MWGPSSMFCWSGANSQVKFYNRQVAGVADLELKWYDEILGASQDEAIEWLLSRDQSKIGH